MKQTVSYIFPIYNEEENIDVLYQTITSVITEVETQYEIEMIFINDGSTDNSFEKLIAIQDHDDRVRVINFARNFGHQMAVTAGLDYARGDAVIIMDSDMQDPPKVSLELIKKWQQGFEVVYAQRRSRQDSPFKRLTAHGFYWMLHQLADIQIPRDTGDFRLIDRKVVDTLKQFKEHNRFLRGMVSYVGFKQTAVLFDRDKRHAGTTGYPLKKMVKFAADGIMGFSSVPLKLISKTGYFISCLSFVGIAYAVFTKLFRPEVAIAGWTFTVVSILFIGGVQLIMLGVLGSYVGRIYTEAQGRPLYIVSSVQESPRLMRRTSLDTQSQNRTSESDKYSQRTGDIDHSLGYVTKK